MKTKFKYHSGIGRYFEEVIELPNEITDKEIEYELLYWLKDKTWAEWEKVGGV